MLSVLHVMSRMLPSGTELQLAGMIRVAAGTQWRPTLCVLYPGYPLARDLADDGIDVVELHSGGVMHATRLRELRRLTRHGGFDVVHTSLWGAGAFARASLIGPGRPAVVMSERRVEDFRSRGRRAVDRVLSATTDAWIGNSTDVCDFVVRVHGAPRERVHLVRNGVDGAVFHPPEAPRVPGTVARLGAVGRLIHQKGFDVLLAALPLVLEKRDVELVIVGEGELRGVLEHAAVGLPVELPGAVEDRADLAAFLRGLDLFVMPSRFEGLPNAVLEAQACGVPVVATAVPGMSDATGPTATLVPPENPMALAAAILAALDAPSSRQAPPPRSFADVAVEHRRVFELALERRRRPASPWRGQRR